MNKKQFAILGAGLVATVIVLLVPGSRPVSKVISSQRTSPNSGIIVVEDRLPTAGTLCMSGVVLLTAIGLYTLRSPKAASLKELEIER